MTSAFSWQNSISFCPASFHIPMDMNLSKLQEIVEDRLAWHAALYEVAESDMT